jgi:carboxymethylenebutenolidase
MNQYQEYFVHEFVEDYKDGHMTRRDMIRRVLYITGGVASTATLLVSLGCGPGAQQPTPTTAPAAKTTPPTKPGGSPAASPAASPAVAPSPSPAATGPRSPLSVQANDPSIDAQDITFQGNGATIMAYQARPRDASGPLPLVLVCHENRGLVEHIRDVTRRFAKEGYLACAVDLLSRNGGTAGVADPAQVGALLSGQDVDPNRHVGDFQAAIDFYKTQASLARVDRVGMTGYCFGGGITWRSATKISDLKAAAPFYGPTPPLEDVPNIQAAVLGVYAEQDTRINQGIEALRQALQQSGKTFEIKVYPGVDHAFHNDTGARWNQEQALAAWRDTLDWFRRHLQA